MDRKPGKRDYAQVPTMTNTLLGVCVIDLGAAALYGPIFGYIVEPILHWGIYER